MFSLIYKTIRYVRVHRRLPGLRNWQERNRRRMPLPSRVQIEPTTRCNLNCVTCTHNELAPGRRNRDLSLEQFKHIVDQLPGLAEIKLQGLGEPLLTPDVGQMVEWAASRGIWVDMISNGTVPGDRLREVLRSLGRLIISVDAIKAETLQKMRPALNAERLQASVRTVVAERDRVNKRCQIGIACVVSDGNAAEVVDIMRFGRDAGVDLVAFVAVENWKVPGQPGYEEEREMAARGQRAVDFAAVRRHYEEHGYTFALHLLEPTPRKRCCPWAFRRAYITCDGLVTPCCIRPHPELLSFGNVFEQPFRQVWNGPKIQAFRQCHIHNRPLPVCDHCPG